MINGDGHIKLIDFGLARDGVIGDDRTTMTFCGTRHYMAPEVYRQQPYNKVESLEPLLKCVEIVLAISSCDVVCYLQ